MKNRIVGLLIVVGLVVGQDMVSGCRSCYITYQQPVQQPAAPVAQPVARPATRPVAYRTVSGAMPAPARGAFSGQGMVPVSAMPVRRPAAPVAPLAPAVKAPMPVQPVQNSLYGTGMRRVPVQQVAINAPMRPAQTAGRFGMYNGMKPAPVVQQNQKDQGQIAQAVRLEKESEIEKKENGVQENNGAEKINKDSSEKTDSAGAIDDSIDAMVDAIVASACEDNKINEIAKEGNSKEAKDEKQEALA